MKTLKNPTQVATIFLGILSFLALVSAFSIGNKESFTHLIIHLFLLLGIGIGFFFGVSKFIKTKETLLNTIISVLILYLILAHESTGLVSGLLVLFSMLGMKFFGQYKAVPLFNPVAFGIGIVTLFSFVLPFINTPSVSWWGANFFFKTGELLIPISLFAMFAWLGIYLNASKKLWTVGTFLVVNFLTMIVLFVLFKDGGIDWGTLAQKFEFTYVNSIIYFFAGIMLIDPKTSPIKKDQQIIFGSIAAILYQSLLFFGLPEMVIFALLGANVCFLSFRFWPKKN